MVENPKQKFFDKVAQTWDSEMPEIIHSGIFKEWYNSLQIKENDRVIDIGCGTGRLIPLLWEKMNKKGKIYALDFSLQMLLQAKKKCKNIPVQFICGSAQNIPVKKNFFDLIIILSTFPHFEDKEKSLLEINRVLKVDGILWIVHLDGRETLNKRHYEIGGAVKCDILPDKNEMNKLLIKTKFHTINIVDEEDRFIVSARK